MHAAFDSAWEEDGFSIPGYEVLGELDRGGMGIVYQAQQINPEREVALKVILPKFAGEPDMLRRFETEANAMATLDHPAILPVYQVGKVDGLPYFSMKLATGGSLAERIKNKRPKISQSVDWVITIASAVHHAHQFGLLHRDLKPANFLFDEQERIYVCDFGVAKQVETSSPELTQTNALVGTPHYLPPEVASGSSPRATTAGDLYSLGAVLYELLTGQRPHSEDTENIAALLRIISDKPVPAARSVKSDIPLDLSVICQKAMHTEPEKRYSSLQEFAKDLTRWQKGLPISARKTSIAEKTVRWVKRHPLPASLVGLLILLSSVGGYTIFQNVKEISESRTAFQTQLQSTLVAQANSERLIARPGFRERVFNFLKRAAAIQNGPEIREEAVAALARIDVREVELPLGLPDVAHPSAQVEELGQAFDGLLAELAFINFVTRSPMGDKIALGHADGFTIVNSSSAEVLWTSRSGTARCAPAWSSDGKLLFGVLGDKKQIITFSGETGSEVSLYSSVAWPEAVAVDRETAILAVLTDTSTLDLVSVSSGEVIASFPAPEADKLQFEGDTLKTYTGDTSLSEYHILRPIGYKEWDTAAASSTTNTLVGASLSDDGQSLLAFSTFGLEVWNVQTREQLDFHPTDNQRIDAVTRAWWLPGRSDTIILQVPGALQKLTLDPSGKINTVEDLDRVPGSNVLDILPNGDWIVRQLDEDGGSEIERWIQGDFDNFQPAPGWMPRQLALGVERLGDEVLVVSDENLTLTLPRPMQIIALEFSPDRKILYGATSDHTIFEWNLPELKTKLWGYGLTE